jgi:hypothetical protein
VLLHNLDKGNISRRVMHLVTNSETKKFEAHKAAWMAMVPETLQNAAVRVIDSKTGNRVYVRQYPGGLKHMVVVEPDGTVEDQKPFKGALITQFPEKNERGIIDQGNRQRYMKIDWVRPQAAAPEKLPSPQGVPPGAIGTAPDTERSAKHSGQSQGNPGAAPTGSSARPDARQSEFRGDDTQYPAGGQPEGGLKSQPTDDETLRSLADAGKTPAARLQENLPMADQIARGFGNIPGADPVGEGVNA